MSETKDPKTQHVHLRVAAGDDELFRSAAAVAGESLSEFLVKSGRERAERVLADDAAERLKASAGTLDIEDLSHESRTLDRFADLQRYGRERAEERGIGPDDTEALVDAMRSEHR